MMFVGFDLFKNSCVSILTVHRQANRASKRKLFANIANFFDVGKDG